MRSDRCRATRSARRRVLTNTSVVRCSRVSSARRSYTCVHTSPDITASSGAGGSSSARSRRRECPASTMMHGAWPARGPQCRPRRPRLRAGEESCDLLDGFLRGRQPDPHQRLRDNRLQPLEREREMRAALVAGDGVNLIDDHRAAGRQHLAPGSRGQQDVQGFGRRHDDVRRSAPHPGAFPLRGVAGAHRRPDRHIGKAERSELGADPLERRLEIAMDVVRQCLQGRNVDDPGLVGQCALEAFPDELIDRGEKRGERLARSRRRRHEHVASRLNRRPRLGLRRRRRVESPREPGGDRGMKRPKNAHRSARHPPFRRRPPSSSSSCRDRPCRHR